MGEVSGLVVVVAVMKERGLFKLTHAAVVVGHYTEDCSRLISISTTHIIWFVTKRYTRESECACSRISTHQDIRPFRATRWTSHPARCLLV